MRTKNREINIFNMSLLDVLTGALGAFMFMMLSFVPYYNIVMQQQLEANPNETTVDKDKLEDLKKQKDKVKELKEKIEQLEKETGILKGTAHFDDYVDDSFAPEDDAVQPQPYTPPNP